MKLYFDKVNADQSNAITEQSRNVTYNLNQISLKLAERFTDVIAMNNEGTTIFPLNQYICIVSISLDQKIFEMVMVDLKDNEPAAKNYAANIDKEEAKNLFMNSFYEIVERKYKSIGSIEFVVGLAPE